MREMRMQNKDIDTTTMGGRIQYLRLQKAWSQKELGFRIGVNNKSVISFYEHDTRAISIPVLQMLASELETSVDYLVNGNVQENQSEDPYIQMALQLLAGLRTEKAKMVALEHIRLVATME